MGNILGSLDLESGGNSLTSEIYKKSANMTSFTIPLTNSDQTQTFDFTGASATISLRGQVIRNTKADLKAAAKTFRNLISGNQSTIEYNSSLLGDGTSGFPKINVKVQDITIEYEAGVPLKFNYTIELLESSSAI